MGSNTAAQTRSQSCSSLLLGICQDNSVCGHCPREILSVGSSCSFLYTGARVHSPWLFQEIESSDIKSELFLGRTVLFTTEKTGKTSLKPKLSWGFSKILRVIAVYVIWKTWNTIWFFFKSENTSPFTGRWLSTKELESRNLSASGDKDKIDLSVTIMTL